MCPSGTSSKEDQTKLTLKNTSIPSISTHTFNESKMKHIPPIFCTNGSFHLKKYYQNSNKIRNKKNNKNFNVIWQFKHTKIHFVWDLEHYFFICNFNVRTKKISWPEAKYDYELNKYKNSIVENFARISEGLLVIGRSYQ